MSGRVPVNLFTGGERGYLASVLKHHLSGDILDYGDILIDNPDIHAFDNMYHFAGPSDLYDFKEPTRVIDIIVNGTINMLNLTKKHSGKFIFASTAGVLQPDNIYCHCKLLMENYIKSTYNNYIILRIPRVYSKCRKKGLMRQIRDNTIPQGDMNNIVEYITLQDFIKQTKPILCETNITHEYTITNRNTIQEIKQWIEK